MMGARRLIASARGLAVLLAVLSALLAGCSRDDGRSVRFYDEDFPQKLSEWRLFSGPPAHLVSNDGVLPYDLNTALFTDYALKYRTVWVPKGKSAAFQESGPLELPVGSILSKTFFYRRSDMRDQRKSSPQIPPLPATLAGRDRAPLTAEQRLLLETRLMVHTSSGWVALPYVWNADQTEATLRVAGEQISMDWTDPQARPVKFDYFVPNQDQCAGCHVFQVKFEKSLRPIGPIALNLNKDYPYAGGKANQLRRWTEAGYITGTPPTFGKKLAVDFDPKSGSVDERARAYLHVQCAHCHASTGPASTSGLLLTVFEANKTKLGFCKTPVAAGRGSGGLRFDIVPGRPDQSILHFRMDSLEPDIMMPELGRSLKHNEGVDLIHQWISTLPGNCT